MCRVTTSPGALAPDVLLPGSIEQYLVTDVPVCTPDTSAADVKAILTGRAYESAADVAVCVTGEDGGRELRGLIPVERCLAAPDGVTAGELMDRDPPVVAPGLDQEKAAWKAAQHGESSLAVVDEAGRFRGLVPPARLVAVLLAEHDDDLARLGGYLRSTASTRRSLDEPVPTRLWHRLPWLLVGLLGLMLAALLVDGFRESLSKDVRLALFILGIVYMADAVGTQTEALVIRGMAAGVRIREVFGSEALTGMVLGISLALVGGPLAGWLVSSAAIGLAIGLPGGRMRCGHCGRGHAAVADERARAGSGARQRASRHRRAGPALASAVLLDRDGDRRLKPDRAGTCAPRRPVVDSSAGMGHCAPPRRSGCSSSMTMRSSARHWP